VNPNDCSHADMPVDPDNGTRVCILCGLTVQLRTVAEHLAAMRADIAAAKGTKGTT
jgi:hypothetical protein